MTTGNTSKNTTHFLAKSRGYSGEEGHDLLHGIPVEARPSIEHCCYFEAMIYAQFEEIVDCTMFELVKRWREILRTFADPQRVIMREWCVAEEHLEITRTYFFKDSSGSLRSIRKIREW